MAKILVLVYIVGFVPAAWVTRRRWWGAVDQGRGLMLWAGSWPLWIGFWLIDQWFGDGDDRGDRGDGGESAEPGR